MRTLRAINQGFGTLDLFPASRMRDLQAEIARRNTVAEAWNQTGQAIEASMKTVKGSSTR